MMSTMATISEALALALKYHQAGELEYAESIYRQILQADPGHAEALHLMGVIASQRGRNDLAITYLTQAVAGNPRVAAFHANLGCALEAVGRPAEAAASLERALGLNPTDAVTHYNLGNALRAQKKFAQAAASYRQAVQLKPDLVQAHENLGNVLQELCRPDEALVSYQAALRCQPERSATHRNLGVALADLGRVAEAKASFARAIQGNPGDAEAHLNHALACLLLGDFERGLPEAEWGRRVPDAMVRSFPQPAWDGSALHGRLILLHAEQGLGDTLHFVRYAALVKKRGGRVIVEGPAALEPLLRSCPAIDRLVPAGAALPDFDVHAPLPSLPWLLGTTVSTIPADIPYVRADPRLSTSWRRDLGQPRSFRIGIVWQGNPVHARDRVRSAPLASMAPLARVPGVQLFSLQKGTSNESPASVPFPVNDLAARLETFADTAAVLRCLDLVVCVDTSIAHLAGALGVPVWLALWDPPDWRWLLGREDSPWYPGVRLFRQKVRGDWGEVFGRMALELHELLRRTRENHG